MAKKHPRSYPLEFRNKIIELARSGRRSDDLADDVNGIGSDPLGNLIIPGAMGSIDAFSNTLYVYHGCKLTCTLVGGPFALQGLSVFGNLNGSGTKLALGDYSNSDVDVYSYTPTGISYLHSVNTGLTPGDTIVSGIFAPTNGRQ
jgi:hypothetical protein